MSICMTMVLGIVYIDTAAAEFVPPLNNNNNNNAIWSTR